MMELIRASIPIPQSRSGVGTSPVARTGATTLPCIIRASAWNLVSSVCPFHAQFPKAGDVLFDIPALSPSFR